MNSSKIHMLNARDNVLLTVINKVEQGINMYEELNKVFEIFLEQLYYKGIDYSKLSRALIPSRDKDKYEYAFVFDSMYFKDKTMFYGEEIINKLLSIINKESTQSIFSGDLIQLENVRADTLKEVFLEKLECINKCEYQYSSQFFIVYINNITKNQVNNMIESLKKESYFVGVMNLKYSSKIKQYLSAILCPICIKDKKKVIVAHLEDRDNTKNYNERGYQYKENGFELISINQSFFDLFLSYKIPNGIQDKDDLKFNYNFLTNLVPEYEKIRLVIPDEKFSNYLKTKKSGTMKALGILNIDKEELQKKILIEVYNNYIYNIERNAFGDFKFNVLIELCENDEKSKNALVSLKYIPKENELRLITMF